MSVRPRISGQKIIYDQLESQNGGHPQGYWKKCGIIAGGMDGVSFAHICVPVFPPVLRLWLFCSSMFLSLFPNPERPLDRARWEGADDSTQASPFGRELKKRSGSQAMGSDSPEFEFY